MNKEVEAYLKSLGNTASEVAASLRKEGITGYRENCSSCPIVRAIYKRFPDYYPGLKILTDSSTVQTSRASDYFATFYKYGGNLALPFAVRDFILNFDNGAFPELAME